MNELFLSGWKEGHKTESTKQIHLVNKLITFFLNESHEKGMVSHWKGYHAD